MASSQAVAEWNAGAWGLENEETWGISVVMVEDGGGERVRKTTSVAEVT